MQIEASCSCKGKSLDHFLQPTILMILHEHEMHGFKMIQEISETPLFGGNYPDPTGLYRYLKKMEVQGLLTARDEEQTDFPSKRIYQITELGNQCLTHWSETLHEYAKNVELLAAQIDQVI